MTDARDLLARYLGQRALLGDDVIYVSGLARAVPPAAQPPAAEPDPAAEQERTSAAEQPKAAAARSDQGGARGRRAKKAESGGARWKKDLPAIPPRGIEVAAPGTDLFSEDPLAEADLDGIAGMVHQCTKCKLCEGRTNAVPGEGPADARLVVVGEGPGAVEDETGRPFVGRAGELLTEILAAIELPREQVYICNIVKCRPPSNRKPQQDEIDACVPYLHRQLAVIKPAVILAMGGTAAETLLGTRQSLGAMRNKVHEFRGVPLVVTYHPAALLRNPHWKKPTWDDVRIARQLVDQRR